MVIEGRNDVRLTMLFRCPPGMPPEQVANQLAHGGITVALGLLPYMKSSQCDVVPSLPEGPSLTL